MDFFLREKGMKLGRYGGEGEGNFSSIFAWRVPRTESLVGYSPQGHKALDMTQ